MKAFSMWQIGIKKKGLKNNKISFEVYKGKNLQTH